MGHPYSEDLRRCAIDFVTQGGQKADACRIFQVGRDTLFRWLKQKKQTGHLQPKPRRKTPHKVSDVALRSALEQQPDATLKELGKILGVSAVAIFYACRRLKLTRKKNTALRRTR